MRENKYPNKQELGIWAKVLEEVDSKLKKHLPYMDQRWVDQVSEVVETIATSPYHPSDIYSVAAIVSYKLIKNHYFIDGNKRTALIVTYLLLFENNIMLLRVSPDEAYGFFHDIAQSPAKDYEKYITQIKAFLEKNSEEETVN